MKASPSRRKRESDAMPGGFRRREFFQRLGAGLAVFLIGDFAEAQESGGGRPRRRANNNRPVEIPAWLHIGEDGHVSVFTGKAEVGQNIRTSLTQAVAEELRVPVASIKMVMADTQLVPYDMGTFGSQTTPDMNAQLRRVGASAREALIDMAAEFLKCDRAALRAEDGKIVQKDTGATVTYGQLTKGQAIAKTIDQKAETAPPKDWKVLGTSVPKVDGREFVTGAHKYTSDLSVTGMLHGKVLRAPSYRAKLISVDASEAQALPGVMVVHEGDFVGVAAATVQMAEDALGLIKAKWEETPQLADKDLFEHLRKTGSAGNGSHFGSMEEGLAAAEHQIKESYTIAYIAHTPLEPRAAVAEWNGKKLTVWTGTQRPFGVRTELSQLFAVPEADVRVIVPDTGSGYGGKHTGEMAQEAARLARASSAPVKLVWTRQEEFTWAYFRPAGIIDVTAGVNKEGVLTAWEFHNYLSGGSALETPYVVANRLMHFHNCESPLPRTGSYRGLAATANHFAREASMDLLARAVKMDPVEFRLKNLPDTGPKDLHHERLRNVLKACAEAFGWGKTKVAKNHGVGIALGTEKNSYLATAAEVMADKESGMVRVLRVTAAFDCGAVVNPDHLKNQIEGAIMMGLGGALFEAIEFADGRIKNALMAKYRVPRFEEAPKIETVLVDRRDIPSAGAGETPIVGIAPAIHNAILNATGIHVRSMPMAPNGLKAV